MRRPATLREVVLAAEHEAEPFARLREFLDEFYSDRHDLQAMIEDEPRRSGDPVLDAYLAAAAEYLARLYGLRVPAWTADPARILSRPYFAGPDGMKGIYLAESPIAFRRRNLFVSHDPLARPRRRIRISTPPSWWAQAASGPDS